MFEEVSAIPSHDQPFWNSKRILNEFHYRRGLSLSLTNWPDQPVGQNIGLLDDGNMFVGLSR